MLGGLGRRLRRGGGELGECGRLDWRIGCEIFVPTIAILK